MLWFDLGISSRERTLGWAAYGRVVWYDGIAVSESIEYQGPAQ